MAPRCEVTLQRGVTSGKTIDDVIAAFTSAAGYEFSADVEVGFRTSGFFDIPLSLESPDGTPFTIENSDDCGEDEDDGDDPDEDVICSIFGVHYFTYFSPRGDGGIPLADLSDPGDWTLYRNGGDPIAVADLAAVYPTVEVVASLHPIGFVPEFRLAGDGETISGLHVRWQFRNADGSLTPGHSSAVPLALTGAFIQYDQYVDGNFTEDCPGGDDDEILGVACGSFPFDLRSDFVAWPVSDHPISELGILEFKWATFAMSYEMSFVVVAP